LMHDVQTSEEVLAGLAAIGVSISIDDFGTGYSSFAYLARFPVRTLKIDRSFVSGMIGSEIGKNVVAGLIALSHALSLRVVAEGAETRPQIAMLAEMGCDEVQGYGYAYPLPFEEFCQFARNNPSPVDDPMPSWKDRAARLTGGPAL
jgi:EAL domain-containing protein (putative c-di-GMP-specific phosphodiesterase class I)